MQLVEKVIVCKLIEKLDAAGFVPVKWWDGEEYQAIDNPMDNAATPARREKQCIDAINTVDTGTLHFAPKTDLTNWGQMGVLLILGNGEDIISNYHCSTNYPAFTATVDSMNAFIDGDES